MPGPSLLAGSPAAGLGNGIRQLAGRVCPVTGASLPVVGPSIDLLRRQAHELIESMLVTFSQATGEKAAPYENQVPLLDSLAPVQAGGEAVARMRVANEEASPSEVTLYSTNFVADSGYEIPSVRVTILPRTITIPAKADAQFDIKISVPQQTAPGTYSGLVQAMGTKYVKAVLSLQVL